MSKVIDIIQLKVEVINSKYNKLLLLIQELNEEVKTLHSTIVIKEIKIQRLKKELQDLEYEIIKQLKYNDKTN